MIRTIIRNILLRLLHRVEQDPLSTAVRRGGAAIWNKEINIPSYLVAIISMTIFFVVLLFELGVTTVNAVGLFLFLVMVFIFFLFYLKNEKPHLIADSEAVMLLGVVCTSAVLVMQLSKDWLSPLATPLAAFTLLIGLLLSRSLALMVAIVLSMILAVLNGFKFEYFFIQLFGSSAGIFSLATIRTRSDLSRIGVRVVLTNVVATVIVCFFIHWKFEVLEINLMWGVVSGVLSIVIVLGVLPYLETFFSRTTNIKLIELADFNQPILKRLMLEAPGTYHHSLLVATLAEPAAEAIGANALFARVGAYYHDIGKLTHPEYFIENQQVTASPHDPLKPTMSSLVVTSHVKDGVALAQAHKLDRVIIDLIEQHHGTSLIHYFYHRALEHNIAIQQESFRYPGPKPRSKVSAIIMLADAVEAASRSVEDPSPARMKDTVEQVINNKFTDGQFSECPITMRDLSTIAESMINTLGGIYHARIEYQKVTPST
ncbi:MAG: HDIG domain-containing metalloprotein [Endomicrobiales bacterium]|jgi:putative nucleotidyltransferase with HDIG domain